MMALTQDLAEVAKSLYVGRHRETYNAPLDKAKSHGTPYAGRHRARTHTPNDAIGGMTRIHVKRCCDGCEQEIGDASEAELESAVHGLPLPSVVAEHGCAR